MWSTFFVHFSTVQMSSSHNNYLLNGSFSCYAEGNKGLLSSMAAAEVPCAYYALCRLLWEWELRIALQKRDDFCKTTKPFTIWKSSTAEILFAEGKQVQTTLKKNMINLESYSLTLMQIFIKNTSLQIENEGWPTSYFLRLKSINFMYTVQQSLISLHHLIKVGK